MLIFRSESAETRQRKRSRESLVKMGGSRVRSASAGRDKRTEMACRSELQFSLGPALSIFRK